MKTIKKNMISFLLIASTPFVFLTSCKDNDEKIKEAQENVIVPKKELVEAKKDSITAIEDFKKDMSEKIITNEAMIANLKIKVGSKSKEVKKTYNEKIIELEKKNEILKTKLHDFKEAKGEDWEFFKAEMKENSEQLEKDYNELNTKN
ncbi:MAG: hypothetical protein V4548_00110 [Bacteroidota bacterium]